MNWLIWYTFRLVCSFIVNGLAANVNLIGKSLSGLQTEQTKTCPVKSSTIVACFCPFVCVAQMCAHQNVTGFEQNYIVLFNADKKTCYSISGVESCLPGLLLTCLYFHRQMWGVWIESICINQMLFEVWCVLETPNSVACSVNGREGNATTGSDPLAISVIFFFGNVKNREISHIIWITYIMQSKALTHHNL